jgi:hypothetical protein
MSYLNFRSPLLVQCHDCQHPDRILCRYFNETNHFQIIRITNIPHLFFERVVPPQQALFFETRPEAELEIHAGDLLPGTILLKKLACNTLQAPIPSTLNRD